MTASTHTNAAGRWFLIVLGMVLAMLGGVFVWLMARSFQRAWEMRAWPKIPCVILVSEVAEFKHDEISGMEFRQLLNYGYEWQGVAHTSNHLTWRDNPSSSSRELVESRVAEFPVGKSTVCHVDPANPAFAILKPDSLAPGYAIWFPGLFVIGGLGIVWRAATNRPSRPRVSG